MICIEGEEAGRSTLTGVRFDGYFSPTPSISLAPPLLPPLVCLTHPHLTVLTGLFPSDRSWFVTLKPALSTSWLEMEGRARQPMWEDADFRWTVWASWESMKQMCPKRLRGWNRCHGARAEIVTIIHSFSFFFLITVKKCFLHICLKLQDL